MSGALPSLCSSHISAFPSEWLPTAPGFHASVSLFMPPDNRESLALIASSSVKKKKSQRRTLIGWAWVECSTLDQSNWLAWFEYPAQDQLPVFNGGGEGARLRKSMAAFSEATGCCVERRWWSDVMVPRRQRQPLDQRVDLASVLA